MPVAPYRSSQEPIFYPRSCRAGIRRAPTLPARRLRAPCITASSTLMPIFGPHIRTSVSRLFPWRAIIQPRTLCPVPSLTAPPPSFVQACFLCSVVGVLYRSPCWLLTGHNQPLGGSSNLSSSAITAPEPAGPQRVDPDIHICHRD